MERFARACSKTTHASDGEPGWNNRNVTEKLVKDHYDGNKVGRAVHIMRDPLDNTVARFHYMMKKLARRGEPETFPLSREGFRAMCVELDEEYAHDVRKSPSYAEVRDVATKIPCHTDFFRYVQWHNLAFSTTWELDIPTLVLRYEDYERDFDGTTTRLHAFLGLEMRNEPPDFIVGKTYRDYFEEEEVDAVRVMVKELALKRTWEHMKHYFE